MNKNNDCAICDQIEGRKEGDLLARILNKNQVYERSVLFEDSKFVVFPSIGPLTPGHIIICPRVHYPSYASLPMEYLKHYLLLKSFLIDLLETNFNTSVHIFEHGNDVECKRIVCTVEHAHMHFVPTGVEIKQLLVETLPWVPLNVNLSNLFTLTEGKEYLFYEAPDRIPLIAKAQETGFQSQFLRQVFANAMNNPNKWNWHEFPSNEDVCKTYMILSDAVSVLL